MSVLPATVLLGPLFAIERNILAVCEDFPNVTIIPGIDLVPHDLQYYADTGLHPNDAGYGFYFQNLWRKIQAHGRIDPTVQKGA